MRSSIFTYPQWLILSWESRSKIRNVDYGNWLPISGRLFANSSRCIFLLYALLIPVFSHAQSPGGVASNLRFWLKADNGPVTSGSVVTQWTDAAGLNNYTQATASYQPTLSPANALFNYNPAVDFRSNRFLSHGPTGPFTADNKSGSLFTIVNLPNTAGTQDFLGFGGTTAAGANNPVMGASGGNVYWYDGDWPISSLEITAGQTSLTDFVWQYNVNNSGVLGLNGRTVTTTGNPNLINTAQGSVLGSQPEATNGYILEAIAYETNLSVSDQQKVRSYLGVKYGLTLAHNYLASDGTVIYNVASYSANVTGIGRDDAQSLSQKQSRSVNGGFVTMGNGTGIAATNAANTNVFSADKSYEIIGDNGLATQYNTAYTPGSFSSLASYYSMSRIWKVQETGTVGNVTISVPGSAGMYLLVNSTASFTSGATEIAMTPDGNGNMIAQVDLSNGQFFTFAQATYAPGNVGAQLQFWLKANAGTSTTTNATKVSNWSSAVATNPLSVTQPNATYQPTYTLNAMNFNPGLDFSNDIMSQAEAGSLLFPNTSDPATIITVSTNRSTAGYRHIMNLGSPYNIPSILWTNQKPGAFVDFTSTLSYPHPDDVALNTPTIMAGLFSNNNSSNSIGVSYNGAANQVNFSPADGTFPIGNYVNNNILAIGAEEQGVETLDGYITEAISYNRRLSNTELRQVYSYLAVKYGITLNHDYLSGTGATIYSVASYSANVTGIGRSDAQQLNQKQSKSVNTDGFVTIGNGAGIATTNATNTNAFSADNSYELIGDNSLATSYVTLYTPSSFTSGANIYSMSRIWKVQETGTVGTVTISAPGSAGMYLLVNGSPSFASGATEYAMTSDGNGNMTAQVDLTNGQYFTFAQSAYAPGAVAPGLSFWAKADVAGAAVGASPAAWPDNSLNGKAIPTVGTLPVQTPNVAHNFHPYFTNFSASNYFYDPQSRLSTDNSVGGVGTQAPQNIAVFAVVRPSSAGSGRITGIDNDPLYAAEPGFSLSSGKPYFYKFSNGANSSTYSLAAPTGQNSVLSWNAGTTNTYSGLTIGLNGTTQSFNATGLGMVGQKLLIGYGTFDVNGAFPGEIQEVIWYKNGNGALSSQQINQIESYLALKYGVTLSHTYLSGTGTTIYDVSSFSANVTGIGREDSQQLNQKQSKSVNSGSRLTIGVSNTIVSTNADHPGSFNNNATFDVFGDNGLTGLSSTTTGGSCPPPPSTDKWTNLAYKVTETGSVPSTQLQFDVNGLGFNTIYPIWMQVASDAGFISLITSVPMNVSGTTATTTYDFPTNQTVYVRFAGNTTTLANICAAPKIQTFHWNGWNYGQKTKTITSNYGISNTLSNPVMVATVTDGTSDPNVLLYKPNLDWWPVFDGQNLFIPRNDNNSSGQANSIVTTKMQFFTQSSLGVASTSAVAAQSVDFTLRDIDGFVGGKDVVKVYGKLGGVTVLPKISRNRNYPFWDYSALTINNATGTITAGFAAWDVSVLGDAYVRFDSPVEEVYVEYTKQNQYPFKVYNDLRIGAINVTCKQPTPRAPLADNVYIYKQAIPNLEKTNEKVTYKFTIQNTNCTDKVIDFYDTLPAGLAWVDSTAVSDLNWASINNYRLSQTLSITSMTVTPGTSYLYASVIGNTPSVYYNQAYYQVTNGTNQQLLSDDPGQEGITAQPTPLTLVANDPEANLVVTKSVDKSTVGQNGIVTYTFKVYNPNASTLSTDFQDVLPGELTFVGGSLTGVTSGTTAPYSGSATLTIRDLSIPASSTLTFGIQANVNSYTIGQIATNKAIVSPGLASGYRIRPYTSNVVSTTIVGPDLTPIMYARPTTVIGAANVTVVVDIVELNSVPTSGTISVYVTKEVMTSLGFNAGDVSIGGRAVNNSVWNFDASSNSSYYILTTNQVIPAGDKLSFGLTGTLTPGATTGMLTQSVVIKAGSGGETRSNNNNDADKIDYFQQ